MRRRAAFMTAVALGFFSSACDEPPPTALESHQPAFGVLSGSGSFQYEPIVPLTGVDACLDPSVAQETPLQLPAGFAQTIIGRQSDLATTSSEVNFDMLTLNETGPQAGRYLYRTHEVDPWAALSRIDLWSGENQLLVEREDWEAFDGLVWTPWGTILMAEERIVQDIRDPDYPDIERGLIYEYFPETGEVVAPSGRRRAVARGTAARRRRQPVRISESRGIAQAGVIRSVRGHLQVRPGSARDLSSGTLYALRC
jgi:hypothetical protein